VFPGVVKLSFEREPDHPIRSVNHEPRTTNHEPRITAVEGDVHQTIVARVRDTARIAAVASRSVRSRFVNGEPAPVGYLGELRIDPTRRWRRLLDEGFEFCRQLHASGDARLYLASVVSDHHAALRLLARRWSASWPRFEPVGRLLTLAIPVRRAPNPAPLPDTRIVPANDGETERVMTCLRRNNARYQLAPDWRTGELTGATPGLALSNFAAAERDGRIVGCAALWDQRAFRQVTVRGYTPLLATFRLLVNVVAPWTGAPSLPPVNTHLELGYVSHLAVDDDDPRVACALISAVCGAARIRGLEYVAIGLPAESPLTSDVRRRFRHRAYESVLHVAFWPDGERLAGALDGRLYLPELGTL
jgi:hypothetical protein